MCVALCGSSNVKRKFSFFKGQLRQACGSNRDKYRYSKRKKYPSFIKRSHPFKGPKRPLLKKEARGAREKRTVLVFMWVPFSRASFISNRGVL